MSANCTCWAHAHHRELFGEAPAHACPRFFHAPLSPAPMRAQNLSRVSSVMEAFITMVTSDSYVVGAVVLAHSLQSTCNVSQTRPIVCMITPEVRLMLLSVHCLRAGCLKCFGHDAHDRTRRAEIHLWRGIPKLAVPMMIGSGLLRPETVIFVQPGL